MSPKPISRVYHLADERNLASIKKLGLMSTSGLLDCTGVSGPERERIEKEQRRAGAVLPGGIVIRDQTPMPPAALARCIVDGTSPADWYALLNSYVFFWIDPERLARQARACAPAPQHILEIDAARMLARHAPRAFVTAFNTGNAMRLAARRGRASFVPYEKWLSSGWAHESTELGLPMRALSHRPVELAIAGAAAEIMDYVIRIRRFDPSV